jgi:hypothetical protein
MPLAGGRGVRPVPNRTVTSSAGAGGALRLGGRGAANVPPSAASRFRSTMPRAMGTWHLRSTVPPFEKGEGQIGGRGGLRLPSRRNAG